MASEENSPPEEAAQPTEDLPDELEVQDPTCITPALVKENKEWRILVYGIDDPGESERDQHHADLLCGILGKEIAYQKLTFSSVSFEKNGVTITIHLGKHDDCRVTPEEVDLLLFFHPRCD